MLEEYLHSHNTPRVIITLKTPPIAIKMDSSDDEEMEIVPITPSCKVNSAQDEDHNKLKREFVPDEDEQVTSPPEAATPLPDPHLIYAPTLSPAPPLNPATPIHDSESSHSTSSVSRHRLSDRQQERLIIYLDDQLLQIKRQFVQRLTPPKGYMNLRDLLTDLNKVIDIIWYSITSTQPSQLDQQEASDSDFTSGSNKITLFGQSHYLLAIADSLVDYLEGFAAVQKFEDPEPTIRIFQKLDKIFARLLDEPEQKHRGLSRTEKVRLESIAERTRISVITVFEHIEGYELEVVNVYEQVLDRIT